VGSTIAPADSGWAAMAAALAPAGDPGVKRFFRGTHRMATPEATLARLRNLTGAMGITRLSNITGLDRIGIPTAIACRPNSRALAVSQGKGLDLDEARAGALMESIESYHAERISLPLKFGSYEDLHSTHRMVDVARLPLVKGTLFHPHLPILWIEGYDLLGNEPVWAPYEMVTANFTFPRPPGFGCFQQSSNGLASGNHPLEAVSHAICEIIERDAMALWDVRGEDWRRERRVDLATVDDPGCRELLDRYERAGVDVAVWEMTTDVGLAAFRCTIAERLSDPSHFFYTAPGAGCHPTREVALSRALTEAAQTRLTFIAGSRDNVYRENYEQARLAEQNRMGREWQSEPGTRDFHDAPNHQAATLREDVLWELERLRSIGVEHAIALDMSRPEIGIPVARVVIPGLEGAAGRDSYSPGARARAVREGRA
jgi:YcaO-like protein with predicted kinase domain